MGNEFLLNNIRYSTTVQINIQYTDGKTVPVFYRSHITLLLQMYENALFFQVFVLKYHSVPPTVYM